LTANLNFKEIIAMISGGIIIVLAVDPIRLEHGFPIIVFAMLSKQNKLAYVVSSDATKFSLYL
jgi:hypothetical protein